MANAPLEQSTVLSEYKRLPDRPTVRAILIKYGYHYLTR